MAMAARMPMIATTIISSISVKPCWTFFMGSPWLGKCTGDYATGVPSGAIRGARRPKSPFISMGLRCPGREIDKCVVPRHIGPAPPARDQC
jgi:hypothetical protein